VGENLALSGLIWEIKTLGAQVPLWIASKRLARSVVDEEAAEVLEKASFTGPDSLTAQHHLAVHWHAKALGLAGVDSDETERAFEKAYSYWAALVASNEFWARAVSLGQRGSDRFRPQVVDEMRAELPGWLLTVHETIVARVAHHEDASMPLAARHQRILLAAPFANAVEACRQRLVDAFAARTVTEKPSIKELEQVGERLVRYCELDPDYAPAHIELLSVLTSGGVEAAWGNADVPAMERAVARGRRSKQRLEDTLADPKALSEDQQRTAHNVIAGIISIEAFILYKHMFRYDVSPDARVIAKRRIRSMVQAALERAPATVLALWLDKEVP
jgi:hypothetical protein